MALIYRVRVNFLDFQSGRRSLEWDPMDKDEHLKDYLELCKGIYLRMMREWSWPWADSPKSEDLIESDDTPDKV
jgi:hypothetical protein